MLWWWRDIGHHNQQDKSNYKSSIRSPKQRYLLNIGLPNRNIPLPTIHVEGLFNHSTFWCSLFVNFLVWTWGPGPWRGARPAMTCFPYAFPMFSIYFHMTSLCLPYVFHMFAIFCCISFATAGGTAFCYRVKNLTTSNPNPTPTLQPWLLDSHGSLPDKKNMKQINLKQTGYPIETMCGIFTYI